MTKPPKIANKNCRSYVEDRMAFDGSNMWGTWHKSTLTESTDKHYVVYSWGHHFPIYIYDDNTWQWFGNKDKISQSTTRHQSQARLDDVDIAWLTTAEMSTLAVVGYTELVRRRLGVTA
jgi:hypothetical protein